MVDWGGKVAAWFGVVAGVSAALAALVEQSVHPLRGSMRVLFVALVVIAAVSFVMLLLTGPRALWVGRRDRRRAKPTRGADQAKPPAADDAPELPSPPVRMSIVPEADGERLRLAIRNAGARGMFTAGVTGITDPDGRPVPGPQSWPIPWLEDGSIRPADLSKFDGRTLDFARFNAGESDPWPHRAYWLFSSLPEPVGVAYDPVRSRDELETQRFVVTVRIVRAEPSANYMDRQFSIGVTSGGQLVCDPVPDGTPGPT